MGARMLPGARMLHILPSVGLTYRLLLSSNALSVSRMCGLLATCRRYLAQLATAAISSCSLLHVAGARAVHSLNLLHTASQAICP